MRKLTALLFFVVLVFACSRKTSVAKTETPSVPKVTYAYNVKAIMDKSCSPCHIPEQGGRVKSFDNYDSTSRHIANIIARVELPPTDPKFMPFKSKKPPLTAEEIATLKNWQASGTPKE